MPQLYFQKRVRSDGQGRNVGFDVPEEEPVTIPDGEEEFSKRVSNILLDEKRTLNAPEHNKYEIIAGSV